MSNYTLSKQAQMCVVGLFQKGLVTGTDQSDTLAQLKFGFDDFDQLEVLNPETCIITDEELQSLMLAASKAADA